MVKHGYLRHGKEMFQLYLDLFYIWCPGACKYRSLYWLRRHSGRALGDGWQGQGGFRIRALACVDGLQLQLLLVILCFGEVVYPLVVVLEI